MKKRTRTPPPAGRAAARCAAPLAGLLLAGLAAAACSPRETQAAAAAENAADLVVHYYRYDGDYEGWNLWVWPSGGEGRGFTFEDGKDDQGFVTARITWEDGAAPENGEFGVIARRSEPGNDWAAKDVDKDRFTTAKEIWIMQGEEPLYTEQPAIAAAPPILDAVAEDPVTVLVQLMTTPEDYSVFGVYQDDGAGTARRLPGAAVKGKTAKQVKITLESPLDDLQSAREVRDAAGVYTPKALRMGAILDDYYYTGADLGLTYTAARSVFKVWAPTAAAVDLALYDDAGAYNAQGKVTDHVTGQTLTPMERDNATGVWTAAVSRDLAGKFYLYRVRFADGTVNYAADPYAKAVSANGQRMAVVDLAATNPAGFQPGKKPAFSGEPQDAVIYELHVRDFSIDPDSGMVNKGKFLAFTETGTVTPAGTPTGIDHLKALGVTHVHLLPSFDYASVNEAALDTPQFNWGYDPQNYNVPEGSYATDPFDPAARIREFKLMVQALHNAGIRVIMDVVYNHTYEVGAGPFDAVVPRYYYRTTLQGAYSNGSGCGNEVASERPMVRKFILESCLYWAREYGVDGFRFDLMALIDLTTMDDITAALKAEVPGVLIYGEPWQAGGSVLESVYQTTVGKQKGRGFAIFNDRIREAVKGGNDDATRGFATGGPGREDAIVKGVMGSVNDTTSRASESINYATAHDNLCLWDKIATSYGAADLAAAPYSLIDPAKDLLDNPAVKSDLLANGIILTSQGIPFFQAGDEFLRSKLGDRNSYSSPDATNRLRWANAAAYRPVTAYYAGLIALRKAHPAFRMDTKDDIERNLTVLQSSGQVVAYALNGAAAGDSWGSLVVAYNGSAESVTVPLPTAAPWTQVVNDRQAGVAPLASVEGGALTLPPLSMAVLHQ